MKMIMLCGEEGSECEVCIDGIHLEHALEFKYLRCVLDESGTDEAEFSRKLLSGRRVGAIRSLFNALSVLGSCMSHCWRLFFVW